MAYFSIRYWNADKCTPYRLRSDLIKQPKERAHNDTILISANDREHAERIAAARMEKLSHDQNRIAMIDLVQV